MQHIKQQILTLKLLNQESQPLNTNDQCDGKRMKVIGPALKQASDGLTKLYF
jgi:hypothetical protein